MLPFNRTSMESKRFHMGGEELRIFQAFNRTSMESKLSKSYSLIQHTEAPFNRTSMESKLTRGFWHMRAKRSFNRTSMESKHFHWVNQKTGLPPLLIEPVWNRN